MYKILLSIIICVVLVIINGPAHGVDKAKVVVIKTTIVGGKQAPKFLSIVPWRLQRQMTLDNKPLGLKTKQLQPLEPIELQKALALLQHNNY